MADVAIETALMLGCAFGMRLRQSQGLMGSIAALMKLTVPIPDHATLSRRAQKRPASARMIDAPRAILTFRHCSAQPDYLRQRHRQ